jgi:hypothetical protein
VLAGRAAATAAAALLLLLSAAAGTGKDQIYVYIRGDLEYAGALAQPIASYSRYSRKELRKAARVGEAMHTPPP